ncbi:MAG: hypothetical protein O7D32_01795 [bacterium]|nr:hypothetical protein [bacterium]
MYNIDMDFWPWIKTDYVLLAALTVLIPVFVVYLGHQRRKVLAVQQQLERVQKQAIGQGRRDETRLHALLRVSQLMRSNNDLQGVFDCITNMCIEAFDCQQASLMLANREGTELHVCAATGHANLAEVLSSRQRIGENIAGWSGSSMSVPAPRTRSMMNTICRFSRCLPRTSAPASLMRRKTSG